MKLRAPFTFLCVSLFVAFSVSAAFADTIVSTGSATSVGEDHSSRQTVSIGSELAFEEEHFGPPSNISFNIPLTYSIPSGFELTSAVIDFSLAGSINSFITGSSVPTFEDDPEFTPASLNPVLDNTLPQVVVYIGDQSFVLLSDAVNGTASVDLVALGYGDLLLQGAPLTIVGSVTLFSFVDASPAPWWGTNAFTQVNIDQYWSGQADAKLTLNDAQVPEPGTFLMLGTGLIAAFSRLRRARS